VPESESNGPGWCCLLWSGCCSDYLCSFNALSVSTEARPFHKSDVPAPPFDPRPRRFFLAYAGPFAQALLNAIIVAVLTMVLSIPDRRAGRICAVAIQLPRQGPFVSRADDGGLPCRCWASPLRWSHPHRTRRHPDRVGDGPQTLSRAIRRC